MKIAVCVRRVIDPEARYRLSDDKTVDFANAPYLMDPGDAATLEAGVAIAEQHKSTVTLYSVADDDSDEVLRVGLAQGASSVVRITDLAPQNGLDAGVALANAVSSDGPPDLILCGVASSDGGGGLTGAALAAELGVPIVQNVLAIDSVSDTEATVQRRRDGGYRESLRVQLPAVFTIERIAATPRFPTTRDRLRAQKAKIATYEAEEIGDFVEVQSAQYQMPPPRLQGILWPAPELSARERMKFLVQGGQSAQKNGSGPVTGDPAAVAEAIDNYLREHGFVASPNSKE